MQQRKYHTQTAYVKSALIACVGILLGLNGSAATASDSTTNSLSNSMAHAAAEMPTLNAHRAMINYIIHCQGCHLRNGEGSEGGAPSMVGVVANFLNAPGGREFLLRVPGVATTALDDAATAEVMNWLIFEFDKDHIPADFKPFTPDEVGHMRKKPYVEEAEKIRAELIDYLNSN
ncbi:hypothetical protein GCM10017044_00760 [Kordiimonas sediminis]|uniref:Cytochrome c domain-containing protein n=1 Tax=Kordiimonas sediminis TaxID=1735581 RepID=A0A919AKZ4_9PROT|nr:cytochrome C [Kordiimonas sediminis]GHF10928.1 hypothetical protein GCM10017044_00760 [Kordiimonas sediminis]